MDNKTIIIGTGAVAAELCSYIEDINANTPESICILGFLDDSESNFRQNAIKYNFKSPYLGRSSDWNYNNDFNYAIAFANPQNRSILSSTLKERNVNCPNYIHPSVQMASTVKLGKGNIIYPNCLIGPNVQLGDFNLITSYSFISHDCSIGDSNFFSTTGLSGNVKIGDRNFFGIRSTVVPSVFIGSDNVIQAGMIVDKNISDEETIFYRFKEKVSIIKSKEYER